MRSQQDICVNLNKLMIDNELNKIIILCVNEELDKRDNDSRYGVDKEDRGTG